MKKKVIEKMPYMIPEDAGEEYQYTARAMVLDAIGTLIVEVFDNVVHCMVPVVRMCYTEKDWAMYYPASDAWMVHSIQGGYTQRCWSDATKVKSVPVYTDDKTWISNEEKDIICTFTKREQVSYWTFDNVLESYERSLRWDARGRKAQRDQQKLDERCADMPEIPQEVYDWCKQTYFSGTGFLYYKNKGRYSTIRCSECGAETTEIYEAANPVEELGGMLIKKPRNKSQGRCRRCGAVGEYKPIGRMRPVYEEAARFYVGQQFRDGQAVIRYIEAAKIYTTTAAAQIGYTEVARVFFDGKKVQKDYHLRDHWRKEEYWAYYNIGGYHNIKLLEADIYPGTWEELKKTCVRYSGAEEFCVAAGSVNIIRYLETYMKWPQIEILSKMGCHLLVEGLIDGYSVCQSTLHRYARTPWDMLGIRKEHIKDLRAAAGDPKYLKVYQMERDLGERWSDEQCMAMVTLRMDFFKMRTVLELMSMTTFCGRVARYAETTITTQREEKREALRAMGVLYVDYLEMRKRQGYDLNDMIIQYPHDIAEAHHKMVLEESQKALDKRIREVNEKYPGVQKRYKKLRRMYTRKDSRYIIRPAKSAGEIVMEGRELHHCVGGDGYLRKHAEGESTILFMRHAEHPEIPYITIEIRGAEIVQWYGAYDKKPDKENVQRYLDTYTTRLTCAGASRQQVAKMA